ncbi:MAG: TylF/MycF/NovP-related O-methyltransferase [Candidatus Acidiferrales bacterium]
MSRRGESPPQIPDRRVAFFKGRFEETLPNYQFVDAPVLVIYLDADLYSSTAFVLKAFKDHIKVGTIICLDDFWDRHHEQRAFDEFLTETGMAFELIAADYGMRRVAFRRTG